MKNKKPILICVGTRPEWLKIKPLIETMNESEYELVLTGQHDSLLSGEVTNVKGVIQNTVANNNRLNAVIQTCLTDWIDFTKYVAVLIQGDTASAFGIALSAFNHDVPVIHLEAGLRTNDLKQPYPEEGYRQMISRITSIHLAPTELSRENLIRENIDPDKIFVVGNTVLDNLLSIKINNVYRDIVLVTMHRRENHPIMRKWFTEIQSLAEQYPHLKFILPIHPNPEVLKSAKDTLRDVHVIEPLNHKQLISLLSECKLVITDSGGIQEESSFLNKKAIVCREITERPEGIATGHIHICDTPEKLKEIFGNLIYNYYIDVPCPYGDGHSSERIRRILHEKLY